ncbi:MULTISPECIES: DUF4870 domain-containing protein [Alteromonas]|jgi:uncharacterized Tic20 family protein|uniref:DUF4870 domain-containing protein n=2 Tax=Alteromonas stellipolaris TaxID=233316 RepID=A0AAW7Z042_9ALTE|nr:MULTISPECIES: DUF4870 domain-containing protein [Alteromonas]ALM90769.1 hypothetical protein AOR13_1734 [Alteromonas stellipolaris LMG 21856]MBZ2162862.1 DUF4870 domain-containing protein [Alteromonas stellipolaris]MDO6535333.1 DUF4870 domain-containing protein [Alteromonas stellipolaris]MDO6538065.1 DUF4870 domain-containing protein [Alteromonas stellipolaris]MDO6575828.1 DUF4870 domain-containing protein [Alteromonas stellipolaris]
MSDNMNNNQDISKENESIQEYWGMPLNTYCMLIHLSQLTSIIVPGLGLILPIVMWAVNKDKHQDIDMHGKVTVNWLISLFIYSLICGLLTLIIIGMFGLIILAILNFIFAIVAAIKANKGELWVYPLSITFLK